MSSKHTPIPRPLGCDLPQRAAVLYEILQSSDLGICVLDNELKVVVWDDWLAEATGLEADLVLGQRIDRLYPQLSGSRFLVMVRAALQKDVAGVLSQRVYNHLLPLYKNRTATQVGGPL